MEYATDIVGLVERNNLNAGKPPSFAGTPSYSSLAVHQGGHPSFKDEVESLGYVLLAVALGGNLPWASATSMEETCRMKANTDIRALSRQHNCPEVAELIYAMRSIVDTQKYSVDVVTTILNQLATRNVSITFCLHSTRYPCTPTLILSLLLFLIIIDIAILTIHLFSPPY
ncbi:hypothetical protein EON65_44830 [archaeon]|nr:MAG: hypothetical protein EON65_44830 [archaeon]